MSDSHLQERDHAADEARWAAQETEERARAETERVARCVAEMRTF